MTDAGHYLQARDTKLEALRENYNQRRLENLGAEVNPRKTIRLPCLKWNLEIQIEPYEARVLPDNEPLDVTWQVLALDYLGASIPPPAREFISFTDFSQLRNYQDAFEGRVTGRLSRTAGESAEKLQMVARECGGRLESEKPQLWVFDFFPEFDLQVVRHRGDEELPATCNVLFPDNALQLLTPESVIVAADELVSALCGNGPAV